MPLRDFNIYNGDITLTDGLVETNNPFNLEETIDNQLKTLIYKSIFYNRDLKNEFVGRRINNTTDLEEEIIEYCEIILNRFYGNEVLSFFINIECLIVESTAYLFFYRENSENQKVLLLNYELTL